VRLVSSLPHNVFQKPVNQRWAVFSEPEKEPEGKRTLYHITGKEEFFLLARKARDCAEAYI